MSNNILFKSVNDSSQGRKMSNVAAAMSGDESKALNYIEFISKVQQGMSELIFHSKSDDSLNHPLTSIPHQQTEDGALDLTYKPAGSPYRNSNASAGLGTSFYSLKVKLKPPHEKVNRKKGNSSALVDASLVRAKGGLRQINSKKCPYKCCLCNKLFSECKNLKEHLYIHLGVKPYHCDICGTLFSHSGSCRRHRLTHFGIKRPSVAKVKVVKVKEKKEKKPRKKPKEIKKRGRSLCCMCNRDFSESKNLIEHLYIHLGVKPFHCDVCGNDFSHSGSFRRHKLTHSGLNRHQCYVCSKVFTRGTHLKRHIKTLHPGITVPQVGSIGNSFSGIEPHAAAMKEENLQNLDEWMMYSASGANGLNYLNISDPALDMKPNLMDADFFTRASQGVGYFTNTVAGSMEASFQCSECGSTFMNKLGLKRHETRVHKKKGYRMCEICCKFISVKSRMKRHMLTHAGIKAYRCETCNKSFSRSCEVKRHMIAHTGEKPFKCDYCEKTFTRSKSLIHHMKLHTDLTPYKCSVCPESFESGQGLIEHNSVVHNGKVSYECPTCGKFLSCKKTLKKHQFLHTGEKPFTCEVCNKTFAFRRFLKQHMLVHSDERRYNCAWCSKTFKFPFSARKHKLVHLKQKPFKCERCSEAFTKPEMLQKHLLIHSL